MSPSDSIKEGKLVLLGGSQTRSGAALRSWGCLFLLTLISCVPSPGPVELRDLAHFEDYLAGHFTWQSWQDADSFQQYWKFTEDGEFSAWIENLKGDGLAHLYPEVFPAGTVRVKGKWSLSADGDFYQLHLSEITEQSGNAIRDAKLDLRWVDGKLRVEIGGVHFMTNSLHEDLFP